MQQPATGQARSVIAVHDAAPPHWVGDGFPVRSVFSYDNLGREALSPFLMLDYAAPRRFEPSGRRRGVGEHPHRGFETVTLVYRGELEHRDSGGHGGRIGPGDVQWMTAGSGVVHEEFHSERFTREGGEMSMMQLWVNLPARDKMAPPRYQTLLDADIPRVELPDGAGILRVVAGEAFGRQGPARTFSPVDVWDARLDAGGTVTLAMPAGHTAALVPALGRIEVNGTHAAGPAQLVLLARDGTSFTVRALEDATVLVIGGRPLGERVVGYGPFVMTSEREIAEAIRDYQMGRFGSLPTGG